MMPWCSWSPVPSISCPLSFSWLTISPALLIMSNVSHWKMNQWWPDAFFNCPSVLESALFNDNEPKHLHKSCKNYLVCYIWRCGTNFDQSIVVLRVGKFKLSDRLLVKDGCYLHQNHHGTADIDVPNPCLISKELVKLVNLTIYDVEIMLMLPL